MNKIILGGIAVLAITAVVAWTMGLNSQKNDLSSISLANVEALAQESGGITSCASWNLGRYCGIFYPASGGSFSVYYPFSL
jgi:hypothetical protein